MRDYILANKKAYDDVAHEYRKRAGRSTEPIDILAGAPLRYARQNFGSTLTVLEVGPGSGEVCSYYDKHGCRTIAMDVSSNILENVREISPHTELIEADILSYELDIDRFEMVYCGALIHLFTLDDAIAVMRTIIRSLKPGGILFINTTIHNESSEGYYEKHDYDKKVKRYRHRYTEHEFETLVLNAGFAIIDTVTTDELSRDKYWLAYICQKPL